MDLNNLTFDELLDAIRSDSGYQNAQAQKIKKEKTTAAPIKELPTEKRSQEYIVSKFLS